MLPTISIIVIKEWSRDYSFKLTPFTGSTEILYFYLLDLSLNLLLSSLKD